MVIKRKREHFAKVLQGQLERVERMKAQNDFVDYRSLDQIIIGVCGGDGIGPRITHEAAAGHGLPAARRGGGRQGGL